MRIQINGHNKDVADSSSLKDIVEAFSPDNKRVVSEVNEQIVSSRDWDQTVVREGDKIELVAFVGGG